MLPKNIKSRSRNKSKPKHIVVAPRARCSEHVYRWVADILPPRYHMSQNYKQLSYSFSFKITQPFILMKDCNKFMSFEIGIWLVLPNTVRLLSYATFRLEEPPLPPSILPPLVYGVNKNSSSTIGQTISFISHRRSCLFPSSMFN